jgi:uncharacterized protein
VKNKNTNLCALLSLVLSLAVTQLGAAPAKGSDGSKHSLWKIQGKENVVYLLGSVHVLKKENYPLPDPIDKAFSNSKIAVFETDIEALQKPENAMKMLTKGQLPAGETLSKQLSPSVYTNFSNYMQKTGMPAEFFESLSPSAAAILLVALELKKLGLDPEIGLDKHFFDKATQESKKIVPLETIDFQINLVTDFTKEEGELLMKSTLKDIATLEKDLDDMLKAWQTGDADKLNKYLNEAMQESPVIYKRMLTDRNRNWLPKIEELAKGKENAIVIVGAGHLVGTEGVVELLKKKGAKITQE